jgi:hypothetical protein
MMANAMPKVIANVAKLSVAVRVFDPGAAVGLVCPT